MPVHRLRGFNKPELSVVGMDSSQLVSKLPTNRICQLCYCVPNQIRTQSCGHGLCEDCWEQIVSLTDRTPKICFEPVCPKKVLYHEAKKTAFTETAALNLDLKCENYEMGCDYTGKLLNVLTLHEPNCKFRRVICLKCRTAVQHRNYLLHLSQCRGLQVQNTQEEVIRQLLMMRLQQQQ